MPSLAQVKCAIDVLRGRMPGAIAMLKADRVSISIHHREPHQSSTNPPRASHWCEVRFHFDDPRACGNAYRAVERLYEMDRDQND